jgi:hypothetical protein
VLIFGYRVLTVCDANVWAPTQNPFDFILITITLAFKHQIFQLANEVMAHSHPVVKTVYVFILSPTATSLLRPRASLWLVDGG